MRRKRELFAGCMLSPSTIGPGYIPVVFSVMTINGEQTWQIRLKEVLHQWEDTPDAAYKAAYERIKELEA